eukprot:g3506.t1
MASIVKKKITGESKEAIQVFVRVRPPLRREILENNGHSTLAVSFLAKDEIRVKSKTRDARCKFDYVFPPQTTQEDVYNMIKDCAQNCIDGFNSTCFAYGQTGSGKTYTMFGDDTAGDDIYSSGRVPPSAGLIPRVVHEIFAHVRRNRKKCTAVVSFMQIYNEQIYDLLRDPRRGTSLTIKEDTNVGLYVDGLSEFVVSNEHECLKLLRVGDESRAVRHTEMNDYSSRSHTIFQIILETRVHEDDPDNVVRSKLNLVDLAGSEKWNVHSFMGDAHAAELSNINLSLHCLGRCIESLAKGENSYVPYRDSKLTRLLQDSIGGTAKTKLLCMLSPVVANADESQATLRFADCAKQVMQHTRITEMKVIDKEYVEKMERELDELRAKVIKYESNNGGEIVVDQNMNNKNMKLPSIMNNNYNDNRGMVVRQQQEQAMGAIGGVEIVNDNNSNGVDSNFLVRQYNELVGIMEAVDRVTSRFFRFEVEEDELQTEMIDHLDRARQLIKKGKKTFKNGMSINNSDNSSSNSIVSTLPFVSPSMLTPQTGSGENINNSNIFSSSAAINLSGNTKYYKAGGGRENNVSSSSFAMKKPSGKKHALKNLKYRVRRKGASEKGDSTVDEATNDAEDAAKLRKKLLSAQKRVEKQRKIQEFLKQKAEKEDAIFKEEIAVLENQKKLAIQKEEKRKRRAKEQKEKLMKWKQQQLAELDDLLNAQ